MVKIRCPIKNSQNKTGINPAASFFSEGFVSMFCSGFIVLPDLELLSFFLLGINPLQSVSLACQNRRAENETAQ